MFEYTQFLIIVYFIGIELLTKKHIFLKETVVDVKFDINHMLANVILLHSLMELIK